MQAVVLLATASTLGAQDKRLTIEAVLALRSSADVALSPDGTQVVYRIDRPRTDDEPLGGAVGELWSVSAAGGIPQRLTNSGFDARKPQWSPDGTRIAWIAKEEATTSPQVHVGQRVGGAIAIVTHAASGVEAFRWAPDSRHIAYTAGDAPTAEEVRARSEGRDWTVFGAAAAQIRLYVVSRDGGEATLVTNADMTVHDFNWSPDGEYFVVAGAPSPSADDHLLHTQPYVVAATGGVPRLVARHFGRLAYPCWSADGKWLAWLASTEITDPAAGTVFAVSAEKGGAVRSLTADYGGTAVWLGTLPQQPGRLAFVGEERQNTVLYSLDLATGRTLVLASGPPILTGAPSFSKDGRAFAIAANTAAHPNEIFVGRPAGHGALRRLTYSNAALADVTLGEQTVTRWRSRDLLEIEGILIKPVGYEPGKRYPVVVHVHGGSENVVLNGWQGSYRDWGQLLAARGYLTLYPNYRGSRGRGVSFVSGNRRDLMGREFEDIVTGLDHLIASGMADGERAGIYGFSWGGYAAGWGATYGSQRFKAAVAGAGIFNWISEAGTNDTRMHEQLAHWDEPLYEHFALYLERSPIHEIRKANTPVLLLHGERDESCPLGQAIEFHTALKWKGVPVELVIYPREGHGMVERAHQADFLARGLEWLDRYLKAPR